MGMDKWLRFQKDSWKRASKDTQQLYGETPRRLLFAHIVSIIIGGSIAYMVLGTRSVGLIIFEVVVIGVLPVVVVLLINRIRAPVIIHSELKNKVIELERILDGDGIDVEIMPASRHDRTYASLRVYNANKYKSVYCASFLSKIHYLYTTMDELEVTERINEYNKPLSWDGGSDEPEVEIKPGQEGFINVARLFGNQTLFTFFGPEKRFSLGKFKIWVNVLCRRELVDNLYHTISFIGCIDTMPESLGIHTASIWECEEAEEWRKEEEGERREKKG